MSTGTQGAGDRGGSSAPGSDGLSFTGGQRRAPAVPGQALAGGGHRQLGPGLRDPQHTWRLHQRPCLPQLDLHCPEGQCCTADTAAATCTAALSHRFWEAAGKGQGPLGSSAQRGTALAERSVAAGQTAGMRLRGCSQPAPLGSARELSRLLKDVTVCLLVSAALSKLAISSLPLSPSSQSSETCRDSSLPSPQASLPDPTRLAVSALAAAGKWISSHGR